MTAEPIAVGRPGAGDLRRRALVGAALIALALVALWVGGYLLWLLVAAAALGMLAEWGALVRAPRLKVALALASLALVLLLAAPGLWSTDRSTVAALAGMATMVGMAAASAPLGFGLCYAGLPAIALLFLRTGGGALLALWVLAVVWATDIGAFFAGRAIGGPRLAPRISPGKTWAGLGGGLAAAAVAGALLAAAGRLPAPYLWLGAPMALVAQAGDLVESAMKRRAGVKDSGRLLPGHGGLLDRLDGAVPVAVLVAALVANGSLSA